MLLRFPLRLNRCTQAQREPQAHLRFIDASSDGLELLERLPAAAAVAERAARGRAEDVLERGVRRAAVRAAMHGRLELDELRRGGLTRRRRRKSGRTELLAARRGDAVGRPRVVLDDTDTRLRPECRDGLLERALHRLE